MDASKLGKKIKVGKNQKTVLSKEELDKIVNVFVKQIIDENFSVLVNYDQIKEKNYSFSAGQYFEVKIEYIELTPEEFKEKMKAYKINLTKLFDEGGILEDAIKSQMEDMEYGD